MSPPRCEDGHLSHQTIEFAAGYGLTLGKADTDRSATCPLLASALGCCRCRDTRQVSRSGPTGAAQAQRGPPREELIAAALELFSTRDAEDVSIDDVASAAGASRALVYHYFGGKQELYVAALRARPPAGVAATAGRRQAAGRAGSGLALLRLRRGARGRLRGVAARRPANRPGRSARSSTGAARSAGHPSDAGRAAGPAARRCGRGSLGGDAGLDWLEHRDMSAELEVSWTRWSRSGRRRHDPRGQPAAGSAARGTTA